MVEEVFPDIYKIDIPLPGSPLKALNAYVLRGADRSLIVDTGWDREECLAAMLSGLQELGVNLDRADIFITHIHSDHFGLVESLIRKDTRVYMGEYDAPIAVEGRESTMERKAHLHDLFLSHGYPAPELERAVRNHPGFRYRPSAPIRVTTVKNGDLLEYGGVSWTCIETPGHSPGHVCLYDPGNRILLSGDHILFDITSNITYWRGLEDPLRHYLLSLEKVRDLEVQLVLPGHRRIMKEHRGRIAELLAHHEKRLNETLGALQHGEKSAWEVASHLSWDIDCRSWEAFPPVQKWFAIGETIAHLDCLRARGDIERRENEGRILFYRR